MSRASAPTYEVQPGDICRIVASVLIPIEQALGIAGSPMYFTNAGQDSSYTTNSSTQSPRPCVFMGRLEENAPAVCLMATYHGNTVASMPEVYQYFSIPVDPDVEPPDGRVIHTTPRWPESSRTNQYLIAYLIDPHVAVQELWHDRGSRTPSRLDALGFGNLTTTCDTLRRSWQQRMLDTTLRKQATDEYLKYRRRKQGIPRSRRPSSHSGPSGRTGPRSPIGNLEGS